MLLIIVFEAFSVFFVLKILIYGITIFIELKHIILYLL